MNNPEDPVRKEHGRSSEKDSIFKNIVTAPAIPLFTAKGFHLALENQVCMCVWGGVTLAWVPNKNMQVTMADHGIEAESGQS